jgi:hypothetical protein
MDQSHGQAIAMLVVGLVLIGASIWRIRAGRSYLSHPAAGVSRRDDPFSFWVSLLPILGAGVFLTVIGSALLLDR